MRYSNVSGNYAVLTYYFGFVFVTLLINLPEIIAQPQIDRCTRAPIFRPEWRYGNTFHANFQHDDVSFNLKLNQNEEPNRRDTGENILQSIAVFVKDTYDANILPYINDDINDSIAWLNITNTFTISESSNFRTLCFPANASASVCESNTFARRDYTKRTDLRLCAIEPGHPSALVIISDNDEAMLHKTISINGRHVAIETMPFVYTANQRTFVISAELNETAIILPTYIRCPSSTGCILKPKITIYDEHNLWPILPQSTFHIFGIYNMVIAALSLDYAKGKIIVKTFTTEGHWLFPKINGAYVSIKIYNSSGWEIHSYDIYGTEMPIEEKQFDLRVDYIVSIIAKEPGRVKIMNLNLMDFGRNDFHVSPIGLKVLPPNTLHILGESDFSVAHIHLDTFEKKITLRSWRRDVHSHYPRNQGSYVTIRIYDSSGREKHSFIIYGTDSPVEERKYDFEIGSIISITAQEPQRVIFDGENLLNLGSTSFEIRSKGLTPLSPDIFHILGLADSSVGFVHVDNFQNTITTGTLDNEGHPYFPKNQGAYVTIKIYGSDHHEKQMYNVYGTEMPIEKKQFPFESGGYVSFIAKEPFRVKLGARNLTDFATNVETRSSFAKNSNALITRYYDVLRHDLAHRTNLQKYSYFKWTMESLKRIQYLSRMEVNHETLTENQNHAMKFITSKQIASQHGPFVFALNPESRTNSPPPRFPQNLYQAECMEDIRTDEYIVGVKAQDQHSNPSIVYSIIDGNLNDAFSIEPTTGKIRLQGTLDYETIREYKLTIRASDGQSTDHVRVHIKILNANDNAPIFIIYPNEITFDENRPITGCLFYVNAYDPDIIDMNAPQNIEYSIADKQQRQYFSIGKDGCLFLTKPLNRELAHTPEKWDLLISASDRGNRTNQKDGSVSTISLTSNISVTISPINIDDGRSTLGQRNPSG